MTKTNELLINLIQANELTEAPTATQREGVWHQIVIEIDADNSAYLTLTDDAYNALFD